MAGGWRRWTAPLETPRSSSPGAAGAAGISLPGELGRRRRAGRPGRSVVSAGVCAAAAGRARGGGGGRGYGGTAARTGRRAFSLSAGGGGGTSSRPPPAVSCPSGLSERVWARTVWSRSPNACRSSCVSWGSHQSRAPWPANGRPTTWPPTTRTAQRGRHACFDPHNLARRLVRRRHVHACLRRPAHCHGDVRRTGPGDRVARRQPAAAGLRLLRAALPDRRSRRWSTRPRPAPGVR